jgi:hypothetical protein
MPSIRNYRGKGNDRNGEGTSGDLQPLLTRAPASIRFNRDNWLCNRLFYRRHWRLQPTNKSIPPPRQCLDKAGALRRVAQHFANLVNGRVEVVIDINKGVGPEALLQLLAGDDFAMLLEQNDEYLESLRSTSA